MHQYQILPHLPPQFEYIVFLVYFDFDFVAVKFCLNPIGIGLDFRIVFVELLFVFDVFVLEWY